LESASTSPSSSPRNCLSIGSVGRADALRLAKRPALRLSNCKTTERDRACASGECSDRQHDLEESTQKTRINPEDMIQPRIQESTQKTRINPESKNQPRRHDSTQKTNINPEYRPTLTDQTTRFKDLTQARPAPSQHKRLPSNNQHLTPNTEFKRSISASITEYAMA
jgi:hypothetical protein